MYKYAPFLLALAFAFTFTGCKEEPPPPPVAAAPPEPTPEEIKAEYRNAVSGLSGAASAGGQLPVEVKDQAVAAFNAVRSKHAGKENGQEALQSFAKDIEQMIGTARGSESWMVVKGGCEIHRAINPASDRFAKLEQKADVLLSRPQVEVTGFIESNGTTDIFLRVTDSQVSPSAKSYTVREGEEFHEREFEGSVKPILKVVSIVGANQAVELEYLPIHDTWTVVGPKQ